MKKIFFILVFILLGHLSQTFSYDTTAAKLYPMAAGNTWSYHLMTFTGPGGCANLISESDYIVSITGDTLMPNSKRYFIFHDRSSVFYRRVDSVKMNIYQYNISNGTDCLYDSLKAGINSVFSGCAFGQQVIGITQESIFGMTRTRRETRPLPCPGCGKSLVSGIGYYGDYSCITGGTQTTINGCIINGVQYGSIILGTGNVNQGIPNNFSLSQNYPNPFNPSTNIKFQIAKSSNVKLVIYDAIGKEVETLVNKKLEAGEYEANFDGTDRPSGVYYYKLVVGDNLQGQAGTNNGEFTETKKMVLIK